MARVKNVFSDTSIVYNYIISGDICSELANGDHIIENTSISMVVDNQRNEWQKWIEGQHRSREGKLILLK